MADDTFTRQTIVSTATYEIGTVFAGIPDDPDETGQQPRVGGDRLLDYFHLSAPGVWSDDLVKYYRPGLPAWCGIFALWAIKSSSLTVGTWRIGSGISAVHGIRRVTNPQPGDIGFVAHFQHHCIISEVHDDGTILSVDGNQARGAINAVTRSRSAFHSFYTAFSSDNHLEAPVGRWLVQMGTWAWHYVFYANGTVDYRMLTDTATPLGGGSWQIGGGMTIQWDGGTLEYWNLPLVRSGQNGSCSGIGPVAATFLG